MTNNHSLLAIVILFLAPLEAQVVPSKIIPNLAGFDDAGGEAMIGGHAVKLACPEGIEDFEWKKSEFSLHFSVEILNGEVVTVSRRVKEDEPGEWVEKFEKSCIAALKQWRFSKVWTKKGELKEWGMTLHVKFETNKFGQCNITIGSGATVAYLTTNPVFIEGGDEGE